MKLKCIVVHQAAVAFDHSTTFVLFVLYLLSIITSMCESVGVCQMMLKGSLHLRVIRFSSTQRSIPRDNPRNY